MLSYLPAERYLLLVCSLSLVTAKEFGYQWPTMLYDIDTGEGVKNNAPLAFSSEKGCIFSIEPPLIEGLSLDTETGVIFRTRESFLSSPSSKWHTVSVSCSHGDTRRNTNVFISAEHGPLPDSWKRMPPQRANEKDRDEA